jgi:hypothetical protein
MEVVGNDVELVKVQCWESFSCHGTPPWLRKLDSDLGLSFPSFVLQYLSKLFSVCYQNVVNHSNDCSFQSAFTAANCFVGDGARMALSKDKSFRVFRMLFRDET